MKILRSGSGLRRGFTLIEMAIVLAIMLAFLAMSIPFFAGFQTNTGLKTAEREIMTVLRTARSYAVTQNANFHAVFDGTVTPNTYRITNTAHTTLDKTYSLPNGVTFSTAAVVTFVFTPNGGLTTATDPTDPTLVNTITVQNPKGTKTITVNRITGALE
jgi:prepilin-type N-terminal cleavage/methylation domain-containing protein